MSKMTVILAAVYFALVEFAIILYSPHGKGFFPPAYRALEVGSFAVPEEQVPDYAGEEIVYDVKMGAVKIGTSVYHNLERTKLSGVDAQLVVFTTKVIQVNDTERIWADVKEFLPLRVERDIRTWPKYTRIVEIYDQSSHSLDITRPPGGKSSRIVKEGPIHNAILLPYQVRRAEKLAPGWSMKVVLPTQEFDIKLKSIEKVTVPAGTFNAFYFESEPERFAIWISADDRRIPVKIRGSGGLNYTMLMRSYKK
ncbi:MAG: DUF3108 domain-containing protein [Candidatus Omnitrophota bacterium]